MNSALGRGLPLVVAVAELVALAGVLTPAAAANDKVLLGGGAGIELDGDNLCTLTTIGHNKTGDLIGFTSAHCGTPGVAVVAEDAEDHGAVGTVVAVDADLDYAVIHRQRLAHRHDPRRFHPQHSLPAGLTVSWNAFLPGNRTTRGRVD